VGSIWRFLGNVSISYSEWWIRDARDSHDRSAEEGNNEHEGPRGDNVEAPKNVANRNSQAVVSKDAVEWVEVALDETEALLHGLGLKIEDGLGADGREIQGLPVDIDRSRGRQHLKDPERTRAGTPAIAQRLLIFAVQAREMGGVGLGRELGSRLLEGSVKLAAVACIRNTLSATCTIGR
jgi:hypothetical protein